MPDIPLQFPWRVAKGGYRWVESKPPSARAPAAAPTVPHRRPARSAPAGFRVLQYQPLAAFPGLFRVFADTEPSHDGIKAFADRFGPLGGDIAKPIPLNDQPQRQGRPAWHRGAPGRLERKRS